jgi:hypothetical protein
MKRLTLISIPFILILAFISLGYVMRSSGSPGGKTGSPGDNLATCTQCHGGGKATDMAGWITTDIPVTGYVPGSQYTVTVRGERTSSTVIGFELTAETVSRTKTGVFSTGGSNQMQILSNGNAITHTNQGTGAAGGIKIWNTKWTAPSKGTGDVTFYAAVNAANGDGGTGGDVIYATNLKVKEQDLSGTDPLLVEPVIKLFPNPAGRTVNLEISGMDAESYEFQIYTINGRSVLSKTLSGSAIGNPVEISLDQIANGTYLTLVTGNGKKAWSRLIVNR